MNPGPSKYTLSKKVILDSSQVSILDTQILNNNILAITSKKEIKIISFPTGNLVSSFLGHQERIWGVATCSLQPNSFATAGEDGLVKIWDSRKKGATMELITGTKLLSVDISSDFKYIAAGGEGPIFVWDIGTGRRIGKYNDMHSDDVPQVKFNPKNILYTGSFDGIVSIFNPSLGETEDEAYVSALNGEQPINKMGFFGNESQYLWTSPVSSGLFIWDLTEETLLNSFNNLHSSLSEIACIDIDYLIDCKYSKSDDTLYLFAGSNEGHISLFKMKENVIEVVDILPELHCDVVRTVSITSQVNHLIAGADDGVIGIWSKSESDSTNKPTKHLKPFDPLSQ